MLLMPSSAPIRRILLATALLAAVPAAFCGALWSQPAHPAPPPPKTLIPIQRRQRPTAPTGEHLSGWMNEHRNLTPEQQQLALSKEPGFSSLPPATQERLRERLRQLNAMPPEQRKHIIARNEAVEHMTPPQRAEFRSAMQQLQALPPDQRRYVSRTFRGLRELKPEQRQNVLNSERFNTLTPAQRSTLDSLLKVEPLLPPPYDETGEIQLPPR